MPRGNFDGFAEELLRTVTGKSAGHPVTWRNVARVVEAVFGSVSQALQQRDDKIKALETRLAEVEKGGVKYVGTWQRAADYKRGCLVTHGGSMWCAIRDNRDTTPGTSDAWQLAVKAGRDAAR